MDRPHAAALATVALLGSTLALSSCGADSARGTQGATHSLGEPTAVFPEDFGTIQTVLERPDGTVLVADPLGNALYLVDMEAGTRTVVGSEGQGPGEYSQPDAVWPLPGGSALLLDLGNGRMTRIAPDLSFGDTGPVAMGDPTSGGAFVVALPQGIDGQGRVYSRAMGGFRGQLPDSAAILRVDRETLSVDTVASFKLQDRIQTTSGDADNRNVSIEQVPLSAEDAWGVAPDGTVVIARSSDYHVEWVGPDGTVTAGAPTPFDPVAIGTAEKEEFVASQGRSGGGIGISVMVTNGAVQTSFSRGGPGGRAREIDGYEWPDTKPPFYSGRLDVDPQGRVWVRRHVRAGEDATYDVFGRDGARAGTVTLENHKRVIGFGSGAVYVVAYDDLDLNYLERYEMPAL